MDISEIKNIICKTIDFYKDDIIESGDTIFNNPELGFKEYKTSKYVRSKFDEMNIHYDYPIALTGVKGKVKGRRSNANICVIGEMDAVVNYEHKNADDKTGAAHVCGHNAQIAMLIGVAYGLVKSGVMNYLDGDLTLFAVPAEEYIEIGERKTLQKQGKIKYLGGKQEIIYRGGFDDVDMALMVHSQADVPEYKLFSRGSSLGFIYKNINFKGQDAHSSQPSSGINALNAALLSITGINANREIFTEKEKIRIEPIITKGGELVNIIPSNVSMETYIRGGDISAIEKGNTIVDRSVKGAAYIIGADYECRNLPGYMPLNQNDKLSEVLENNALNFIDSKNIIRNVDMIGSTDMGDLSQLLPCIQPTIGGFIGKAHSKDFSIIDKENIYITTSKIVAMTIAELLYNNAVNATEIKNSFIPHFNKKKYLEYLDGENTI